ncbi:phosphoglycerate dehydrogenase [Desulfovibrio ferrophilus]|uniref:Phosphoglycerate dehydrogenase n=1 Tax=Desulfovibrio ferrophilus TaxID=241368 RepID=A0A2Z6AX66_9BACT|nr:phosphoglycerate dehydrogenase [Desulfovibrio ferrophilus]BBD07844.1 phosphoglycerate dehydrogenase [Desulfovibrio ferrophilus]
MKIALTTSSFATYSKEPLNLLSEAGIEYIMNPHGRKLAPTETVEVLQGCQGVVAGTEELSAAVLAQLPELKVLSRCGVGMDSVDIPYCEANGITVLNTPFGPTQAVAELTLGLILDLMRNVTQMDRELRSGTWKKRMGWQLSGKKVGVIGFGRIGQAVADVLRPMGCEIAYADPYPSCKDTLCLPLNELMAWADIVTLHCSKPSEACALVGREQIQAMRPGSWIVNCGRGGLVDESALYEALASGHLSGAAVDCFNDEPYTGPLSELENVVLTPHIGSYAREGRIQMEIDAVQNLIGALK